MIRTLVPSARSSLFNGSLNVGVRLDFVHACLTSFQHALGETLHLAYRPALRNRFFGNLAL